MAYDDASGKKHDLYIDYEGSTAIPVPLVFWKVIYDEEANKGVGFIGLNDVFADEHTNFLCTNVCEKLEAWIGDGLGIGNGQQSVGDQCIWKAV